MLLMDEVLPEASLPDFALQVAISMLKVHHTRAKFSVQPFICIAMSITLCYD